MQILPDTSSAWFPIFTLLLGSLFGAFSSIIPSAIIDSRRNRTQAKRLKKALRAEVVALMQIIEKRHYLSSLDECLTAFNTDPTPIPFCINIPQHYSRVFQANLDKIGLLSDPFLTHLITFHQLIDSAVQDVKPGGAIAGGGTHENFLELHNVITHALKEGMTLTK